MKQTKHILATIAMLLCSITASAQTIQIDGIWYYLDSDTKQAEVTMPTNETMYSDVIVIPATIAYDGVQYSVTSIGDEAFSDYWVTSITIPESVTSIGGGAFRDCSNLTSIIIPESVTSIGRTTFNNCRSLTSITIPEGVTKIGENAFGSCSSLTSITSYAITPPRAASSRSASFYGVNRTIPVYVPAESVEEYRSATGWKDFTNIIGMETGIENVENPQPAIDDSSLIHDLHGRRVTNPTKGIYIVDGKRLL